MAEEKKAREELLSFPEKKAFDPVLRASDHRYSGAEKKKLDAAKQTGGGDKETLSPAVQER